MEMRRIKNGYSPNEFKNKLLFATDDSNFVEMCQLQKQWTEAITHLFADLAKRLADYYQIETENLQCPRWGSRGFIYRKDGKRHACIICWPGNFAQPQYTSQDYVHDFAKTLKIIDPIDDVIVIWLIDKNNEFVNGILKSHSDHSEDTAISDISAPDWFAELFGKEEEKRLLEEAKVVQEECKLIQGMATVAMPTEYELASFRNEMIQEYREKEIVNIEKRLSGNSIDQSDFEIIRENMLDGERFKVLFGNSDFASSFLSSEWRYKLSLISRGIEQTGTVAGYIKSVEQLMFRLLSLWADNEIKITSSEESQCRQIARDFLNEYDNKPTLGSMKYLYSFKSNFGSRNLIFDKRLKTGEHGKKVREFLFQTLNTFVDKTRNDKFHKANFEDYQKVDAVRNDVLDITFVLLGSLRFNEEQYKSLKLLMSQNEVDLHELEAMSIKLNTFLDSLSDKPPINADLLVYRESKSSEMPSTWAIVLGIQESTYSYPNKIASYDYRPPRGMSSEDELSCINQLVSEYVLKRCSRKEVRSLLTGYWMRSAEGEQYHINL